MNNDLLHNGNLLSPIIKNIQEEDALRQAAWPGRAMIANAPPYDVFTLLPGLMEATFRGIPETQQRRLMTLCRLLSNSMHSTPDFVEGTPTQNLLSELAAGFSAALFESSALLASLFGGDDPIWDTYRINASSQIWCNLESDAYARGNRRLQDLDLTEYEKLTRARYALARVSITALARFSDTAGLELLTSLDDAVIGIRLLRDLRVWKTDLVTGRPNFVLAEISRMDPELLHKVSNSGTDARELSIVLHGRGVASSVLDLAVTRLESAYENLDSSLGWRETLELMEREARKLRGDLLEIMSRPKTKART